MAKLFANSRNPDWDKQTKSSIPSINDRQVEAKYGNLVLIHR